MVFRFKKQFLSFIVILFGYLAVCAQPAQTIHKGGIAQYKIVPLQNKHLDFAAKENPRLPFVLEQLTLSLRFTDSQAAFNLDDHKGIDKQDLRDAIAYVSVTMDNEFYWQDFNAAYYIMREYPLINNEHILLIAPFEKGWHTGWKITEETKLIAGYRCFKATREDMSFGSNGEEAKFPVIAWFCPELPFAFGPFKYGGLPGLILELQTYLAVYGATNITLGEPADIPPMPDLNRIPEELYYKKLINSLMKRRKRKQIQ